MLTCELTRGMSPGGESVIVCQLPSTPTELPAGFYSFQCQSQDRTLDGRQLQFEWTGSEWHKNKSLSSQVKTSGTGSTKLPKGYSLGWNSALESWLSKPFVVTKKERKNSSLFSNRTGRLTVQLVVSKRGVQPGDDLSFVLSLKNCFGGNVEKIKVEIVGKTTSYLPEGRKISLKKIVSNEKYFDEIEMSSEKEIDWASNLMVPNDLIPSLEREWRCLGSLKVSYFIQFSIIMSDGTVAVRGAAPIIIGRREKI